VSKGVDNVEKLFFRKRELARCTRGRHHKSLTAKGRASGGLAGISDSTRSTYQVRWSALFKTSLAVEASISWILTSLTSKEKKNIDERGRMTVTLLALALGTLDRPEIDWNRRNGEVLTDGRGNIKPLVIRYGSKRFPQTDVETPHNGTVSWRLPYNYPSLARLYYSLPLPLVLFLALLSRPEHCPSRLTITILPLLVPPSRPYVQVAGPPLEDYLQTCRPSPRHP
jgi:hypothetical protein